MSGRFLHSIPVSPIGNAMGFPLSVAEEHCPKILAPA
jgi:hypothetical protein